MVVILEYRILQRKMKNKLNSIDKKYLDHCLTLAEASLKAGDKPFGSILVNSKGQVLAEARNRVKELNVLAHPEYELAAWAVENLSSEERKNTRMYTTGEHCPMCSAAHGWVGLGTIVYLSSAAQLNEWLYEINQPPTPINLIPIQEIIPGIEVRGPGDGEMLEKIKALHMNYYDGFDS